MTNYLRPDEISAENQVQSSQNFASNVKNTAKSLALGVGSAALGASLTKKILPFLNDFIPTELALKGISKISPKIGEFLRKGQSMGLDVKQGMNFLKQKINGEDENSQEEKKENPKQNRSVIEQYSPELYQFLQSEVGKGRPILEAGAIAQSNEKFKKSIQKMEKDHKTDFSAILQSVFGQGQGQTKNQPDLQQSNPQTQQPQIGQGSQALLAALQDLKKIRGG